jgi:predicted ribosomally synthesized peptide with nif11-like leader
MSIESAQAFLERMKTDEEFAKKISECKDVESHIALVNEEGFDFTKEEVLGLLQSELTDEELEGVSGGTVDDDFVGKHLGADGWDQATWENMGKYFGVWDGESV